MTSLFEILLDASLRDCFVAAAVGLTLAVARVRSSSLQHSAWLCVMAAMPLMLVLPYLAPTIEVPTVVQPALLEMIPSAPQTFSQELPPQTAPPARAVWRPEWPMIAVGIYAVVLLVLLTRVAAGWLGVARLVRTSRRVTNCRVPSGPIYESALVAAPVTAGIWAPRVLLPTGYDEWPEHKLRAVLAHELSHVRRRDTLVNLAARLNRCVFWFHPLAWWLERQLAVTAEQACDEAAIRETGDVRSYAQVLLDVARSASRSGCRLRAGFHGTGLLDRRVAHILQGHFAAGPSGRQRGAVMLSCVVAILLIAGCARESIYTRELKPRPEDLARRAENEARKKFYDEARGMSAEQAASLEAALSRNPQDAEARRKLLFFYQWTGPKLLGEKRSAKLKLPHILWLIKHDPDQALRLVIDYSANDPEGYEQAKKLWLAQADRAGATAETLLGAAGFVERRDPQLAEQILLRVRAAYPKAQWQEQLGRFYASMPDLRKLEASNDAAVLTAGGSHLVFMGKDLASKERGRPYLERALKLDPSSKRAAWGLQYLRNAEGYTKMKKTVRGEPSEEQYKAVWALPERERFELLASLAAGTYIRGEMLEYYKHDRDGAAKAWDLSRRYAHEALRLVERFHSEPNCGNASYTAHMTLGMVAMRVDGNKRAATERLLEASRAPVSEGHLGEFTLKLPVLLLKYGGPEERKAVIEYLERHGKVLRRPDLDLLHAAKLLREGYMPAWYLHQSAQLK